METETGAPTRSQLQFIPLSSSHGGVYTCQATLVGGESFTKNYTLHVIQKRKLNVHILIVISSHL